MLFAYLFWRTLIGVPPWAFSASSAAKDETFAGVPYDIALAAVDEIRHLVPENTTMAQFALRWILMNNGVTTVIPGARTAAQAKAISEASEMSPL